MRLFIMIIGMLVSIPAPAASARAADSNVIFDMDTVIHKPTDFTGAKQVKKPVGTVEGVDGKFRKAVKFSFVEGAIPGFFVAPVRPTADWDAAEGFSFWLKGDGSNSFGGIEMIDRDDFSLRYGYCFPIDSTEWKKITVRWSDLTPELKGSLVDAKKGYAPSHFGNFWFGKWFYYREAPAASFTIDQVVLEPTIPAEEPAKVSGGVARVKAKLAAHQPVTIVTMGDSLSDKHHWANREIVWSELLAKSIKDKFASDVKLVNPAIGGTTLSQNMVLIPRWLHDAPKPDLVIVWFGGNDWDTGVRGPLFANYLRLCVDRIRQQTGGSADILLMTTENTFDRWDQSKELEDAVKTVANEKKSGLVDIAAEFRKTGTREEALKREIWAWDKVHLGKTGHRMTADAVLNELTPG